MTNDTATDPSTTSGPASGIEIKNPVTPEPEPFLLPDKLTQVVTWVGTGFALAGGIVGYFGLRDAALNNMLRLNPATALVVFCLLGAGVVLGLFAPALSPKRTAKVWPVVAVLTVTVAGLSLVYADITVSGRPYVIAGIVLALGVALAWLTRRVTLPVMALATVTAVAGTSLGLYGTAKVSLLYNREAVGTQITASVSGTAEDPSVAVNITASGLDGKVLVVKVMGSHTDGVTNRSMETLLGEQIFRPDASGNISQSAAAFPVPLSQWHYILVRAATETLGRDTTPQVQNSDDADVVAVLQGRLKPPRLAASLLPTADGSTVTAAVEGTGISPTAPVDVELALTTPAGKSTVLGTSSLTAAENGVLGWSFPLATKGVPAGTLQVAVTECRWPANWKVETSDGASVERCGDRTVMATYTISPAPTPSPSKVAGA